MGLNAVEMYKIKACIIGPDKEFGYVISIVLLLMPMHSDEHKDGLNSTLQRATKSNQQRPEAIVCLLRGVGIICCLKIVSNAVCVAWHTLCDSYLEEIVFGLWITT